MTAIPGFGRPAAQPRHRSPAAQYSRWPFCRCRNEKKRLQKRHTASARAYEAYLRGPFRAGTAHSGGASPKPIECFEKAIREDPQYALAHAGLAEVLTLVSAGVYMASSSETAARAPAS